MSEFDDQPSSVPPETLSDVDSTPEDGAPIFTPCDPSLGSAALRASRTDSPPNRRVLPAGPKTGNRGRFDLRGGTDDDGLSGVRVPVGPPR